VPYPPVAERFERLEETLQICQQMWSDNDGPFDGRHYQLAETICEPRPISTPRPPILIVGSGEQKTLRLVARHADSCNLFTADLDAVAHKLDVLARHCDAEGRDPAAIERTALYLGDPFADVDAFVAEMTGYAGLGVSTVDLMPSGDPVGYVERVGVDIIPRLADLGPDS
jgi:alkanesulfonate monooxygenase SsuD/methylene tetrahydromethanopterin reductase-like flavin-dependent oxidoreductase (luciferase family)